MGKVGKGILIFVAIATGVIIIYFILRAVNVTRTKEAAQNNNVQAFLKMIRGCEGTLSDNGYRYLFGSTYARERLFDSYADHPGIYYNYTDQSGKTVKTSAAGAYQITKTTWSGVKLLLGLPDFSPESQDLAAIELIREKKALDDITAGRLTDAITKCRKVWASLPGSDSNQPERSLATATKFYTDNGGQIA